MHARGRRILQESMLWGVMLAPLVWYGTATLQRPERAMIDRQPLFQGIAYSRRVETQDRPQLIHILEIDLTAPGLEPFSAPGFEGATPNAYEPIGQETLAQRTSDFLQEHQLQVAVNANFFYPFREETPWNYEPHAGQPVNMGGTAISEGELVSLPQEQRPSLCFLPERGTPGLTDSPRAVIVGDGICFAGTEQAVSGNTMLLDKGQPTTVVQDILNDGQPAKPYPMNIAALDATGTRLWLILVDGKQPFYSEGMTLQESIDLVQSLGGTTALRLDGGGSTTLAVSTAGRGIAGKGEAQTAAALNGAAPRLLNAVIHAKIPGQERPVANHLGFFAEPLQP